jgi:hypothetical protein
VVRTGLPGLRGDPKWLPAREGWGYAVQCQSSDEGVSEPDSPVSGAGILVARPGIGGTRVCPGGEEVGHGYRWQS